MKSSSDQELVVDGFVCEAVGAGGGGNFTKENIF